MQIEVANDALRGIKQSGSLPVERDESRRGQRMPLRCKAIAAIVLALGATLVGCGQAQFAVPPPSHDASVVLDEGREASSGVVVLTDSSTALPDPCVDESCVEAGLGCGNGLLDPGEACDDGNSRP